MKVNSELKINNYVIEIWINLLNMVKILSDSDNSLSRTHDDWAQISASLLHLRQTDFRNDQNSIPNTKSFVGWKMK